MSLALEKYCIEKNMTSEEKNEIKNLFIDILLENCTIQTKNIKIDTNNSVKPMEIPAPMPPKNKDTKKAKSAKKFSTVKTAEFADENGVTLDDFESEDKITKADIVQFLKKRSANEPSTSSDNGKKLKPSTTQREPCHGLTKTGDVCKTRAKADKPEGASFHYCPKHFDTWKLYETQSDTECEDSECEDSTLKGLGLDEADGTEGQEEEQTENQIEEQDEFEDEGAEITEEDLFN